MSGPASHTAGISVSAMQSPLDILADDGRLRLRTGHGRFSNAVDCIGPGEVTPQKSRKHGIKVKMLHSLAQCLPEDIRSIDTSKVHHLVQLFI